MCYVITQLRFDLCACSAYLIDDVVEHHCVLDEHATVFRISLFKVVQDGFLERGVCCLANLCVADQFDHFVTGYACHNISRVPLRVIPTRYSGMRVQPCWLIAFRAQEALSHLRCLLPVESSRWIP